MTMKLKWSKSFFKYILTYLHKNYLLLLHRNTQIPFHFSSSPVLPPSSPPRNITANPCPYCSPQASNMQTESKSGVAASAHSGLPSKDFEIGLKNWHYDTVMANCNK